MRLLLLFLLLIAPAAWAQDATPLSVTQFIAREKLGPSPVLLSRLPSIRLSDQRTPEKMEEFNVEGYVQAVSLCPPCPAPLACEPCASTAVLADAPDACPAVAHDATAACPGGLIVNLDFTTDYSAIKPGMKLRLNIETQMTSRITQMKEQP